MPPSTTKNAYDGLSYSIKIASKQVTEKSMSDATAKLRGTEEIPDVAVFVDGRLQRKGFSSTLVLVTAISIDSRKVLHVAILSNHGKAAKYEKMCLF